MPWQMVNPNARRKEEPKARHPIETTTGFYLECEYVYTHLGMMYEDWLDKSSDSEKMLFRSFIRLHRAKEIYSRLPEKERASFLA